MLVVHHPDQALHDPDTVFRTGRFLTQPDRADAITQAHDQAYVDFRKGVFARWTQHPEYGPVAIPNVHPTHRMHRKPTELLGGLGWYSNSTSCPIAQGTWPAIFASAQAAVHGADRLQTAAAPVYAMSRPPGHHTYPDLMTGVWYLNNAAIAAQQLTRRFGKVAA